MHSQRPTAVLVFLVVALALPLPLVGGESDLIFRDDFEWGVSRWSETVPDAGTGGVVWEQHTSLPTVNLANCDLPVGTYRVRVRAENDQGGTAVEVSLTIADVPCERGTCRQITVDPIL